MGGKHKVAWLLLEATIVLAGAVVLVIQGRRKLSA